MKSIYTAIACCLLLIGSCKKDEGKETCFTPDVQINASDKTIRLDSYDSQQDGYEVEYGPAGFSIGSGTRLSYMTYPYSFSVTTYGEYDFFVRKKCTGGNVSDWTTRKTINVDGSSSDCAEPLSLDVYTGSSPYRLNWYASANFYDVEYGPTGFPIGNGTRLRTNNLYTSDAIMNAGTTYDFYVRSNCGGNKFSSWAGPHSVYAATDQNVNTPCNQPSNVYAYKINSQEINYSFTGNGNVGYEMAISDYSNSNNGNIISTGSPNGTIGTNGTFTGDEYFWVRGRCANGSFTSWVVEPVQ